MTTIEAIIYLAVALAGTGIGYALRKHVAEGKLRAAEEQAKALIEEARKEAEAKQREILVEGREQIHRMRQEQEARLREERQELQRWERRVSKREEGLERRQAEIAAREAELQERENAIAARHAELDELYRQQRQELERLAGLTSEEAKNLLLKRVEEEVSHEMAIRIKEIETQAKEEAEARARRIVSLAVQRYAADHTSEATVSVVPLPSDDMKGRIIGREGRNIRTLEMLTGVDLIIDDTPEAVILSAFDPVRREIARIALEKLINDGRIHPARIEEMVEKARREVERTIREEGEQATFDAGVAGLHPELIKLLGRLKFRYSYGQNVLKHSIEVAHLAGMMAAELGANQEVARRAGLLHDIGKAVDHEVEGSHLQIGMDLLKRYKEPWEVIHAMSCHHGDYEPQTIEAALVTAADAISASRPGARRESLDNYIKRLRKLESIADSFDGVEKSYAIQAGREIRIMVKPDKISDAAAAKVARDIVKRIESELEYPGQIKVTVIRETRAVEYAR